MSDTHGKKKALGRGLSALLDTSGSITPRLTSPMNLFPAASDRSELTRLMLTLSSRGIILMKMNSVNLLTQ